MYVMYGICLPRSLFRDLSHVRHVAVQLREYGCRTGIFTHQLISVVVRRQCTSGLCRCVPRLQARAARVPDDHVEHPAGSPDAAALVPERLVHHHRRWYLTVRRVLRRVVLYTIKYVDGPVLLRVWLYWISIYYTGSDVLRDHDRVVLLPAVFGEPPLVVAVVLDERLDGLLRVCILRRLLPEARRRRVVHVRALLRVHGPDMRRALPTDRDVRLPGLPLVHEEDLREHQGRLGGVGLPSPP
mmetsp:Transcript_7754/g.20584  ORF Transcript_7754/g.20584 Transcript_7754/m.20584 type:complete len:242 (-) Transcript_7754:27-752(-)